MVTKKTKHVLVQRFSKDAASEQHDDADKVPDVEIDEAIDQSLEVFSDAATALDVAPNVGTQGGSPFVSASLITPLGNGDHEEEDDSTSEKTPSVEVSVRVTPEPSSKKGKEKNVSSSKSDDEDSDDVVLTKIEQVLLKRLLFRRRRRKRSPLSRPPRPIEALKFKFLRRRKCKKRRKRRLKLLLGEKESMCMNLTLSQMSNKMS